MPQLSVVLPAYNAETYIREAIDSILNQTFQDFELIVMDDQSTDGTAAIVQSFSDPRIRYVLNPVNLGRAGTDNASMAYVRGSFIARMDSDDICHPDRFEKQLAFLNANADINVVGSWVQNFGASTYLNKYPDTPALAKCFTLFRLPVGNPSVMMRATLFTKQGFSYDASLRQTEDFDFFARYINELRVVTLPETLIRYRVYPDTYKTAVLSERHAVSDAVRSDLLRRWGIPFNERELQVHNSIAVSDLSRYRVTLAECDAWLGKIANYNHTSPWFETEALMKSLAERWFSSCYLDNRKGFANWKTYHRGALSRLRPATSWELSKFFVKSLIRR